MTWDVQNTVIRIIDKKNSTPTPITTISEDYVKDNLLRLTLKEDGPVPTAVLTLDIPDDGTFIRKEPKLFEKDSPDKYLFETQVVMIDGSQGEPQRYRLAVPTIEEDKDFGEVISVQLESIAIEAINESRVSLGDELISPKQRVINLLTAHNGDYGNKRVIIAYDNSDIDLPDSDALKFDYNIDSPQPLGKLFDAIITRLNESAPLGGVFKDFYYKTWADPISTNHIKIKFEQLGKINSGVIISPDAIEEGVLSDKAVMVSNKKRKKVIVVKYAPKRGKLPNEHAVFASKFLHASVRREWDSSVSYKKGSLVKYTHTTVYPNIIRYFECTNDVKSNTNPDADNPNWIEDFTLIPPWNSGAYYTVGEVVYHITGGAVNYYICTTENDPSNVAPNQNPNFTSVFTARPQSRHIAFFSPSPWTANLANIKASLAGSENPPAGYVGYALDWNCQRMLNDTKDYTNRFKIVTGKMVRRTTNTPPTGRELYNGSKFLVGENPTDAFSGHKDKIAEYVRNPFSGISPHWEFSDDPIDGDVIFNHNTAQYMIYSSKTNTYPGPPNRYRKPVSDKLKEGWNVLHDPVKDSGKPTCAHAVKDIRLVKDQNGIPGQAVELRFDWFDAVNGGDDINRTSRGAFFSELYPLPFRDVDGHNLGKSYGGDGVSFPSNPYISHLNLNQNRRGLVGWNRGNDSEDQGRIFTHTIKAKLGIFRSNNDSIKSKYKYNIPMIYARCDAYGRWWFKEVSIQENDYWDTITITLPYIDDVNYKDIYHPRLDEFIKLFGYTLPWDFYIKEKDFSGVAYEWRRNQSWCLFTKDSYNNFGLYAFSYRNFTDQFVEATSQFGGDIIEFFDLFNNKKPTEVAATSSGTRINHMKLTIGESTYDKDGYAVYPSSPSEEPRFDLVRLEQETDYLTAKAKAKSTYIRNNFYPNERHVGCIGDVRIKYGQLITESGPRVPGGTLTSVVASKEEVLTSSGYDSKLFLVRKFVI